MVEMMTHSMHGSFVVICIFIKILFNMKCQQTEKLLFFSSLAEYLYTAVAILYALIGSKGDV